MAVSPDGQQIAFTIVLPDKPPQVYIRDLGSSDGQARPRW